MYRVALCEDEQVFAERLETACRTILEKLGANYHITAFESSAEFLAVFSSGRARYDLILLDIIMPGMDGMTLAHTIRETDKDATIIFITSTRAFLAQGYDVRALHYLEKPADEEKLARLITSDYRDRFQKDYIILESRTEKRKINVQSIICMETVGRRVMVTLEDGTIFYPGKLTELLAALPKGNFVRCHQAYAANLVRIRELTGRDVVMTSGHVLPMSRTWAKDVRKAFVDYLRMQ